MIQSDSFVCHSANFDPWIKKLLFLNFTEAGLLKTVQNYLSGCHGSRKIGKTKGRIKLNETSLFTILNMVLSLHFVNHFFNFFIEYMCCYFWILHRLGCWKMYKTSFQDVLEAEKWAIQKPVLFFKRPVERTDEPLIWCICRKWMRPDPTRLFKTTS